MTVVHDVEDPLLGSLTLWAEPGAGRVGVRGGCAPEVLVERVGDGPLARHVPIGSRDPAALRLAVDGRPAGLRPSKGRISRRSYRVRVDLDGTDLLLTPSSPTESRLVRGRSYRGDNEVGTFERSAGGLVTAVWSPEVSVLGATVPAAEPTAAEAAVGYALAAAFGTGARFFLAAMLEGAGDAATPW